MIGNERRVTTRLTFSLVLVTLSAAPVRAQQPVTPAQQADTVASRTHVVRPGDTLWDIAEQYLADPFQWPRVYDLNTGIVQDPHWIYPKQELVLPGSLLRRDLRPDVLGTPWTWEPGREQPDVAVEPEPTVIADVDLREPVIRVGEYLGTPWVADPRALPWAGRVVALADPTTRETKLPTMLRPFDQVHVGRLTQAMGAGDTLQVVRVGRRVEGQERIIEPVALLQVDSVGSEVTIAHVVQMYGPAREDDPVLVVGVMPEIAAGEPTEVETGVEGRLYAMLDEQPLYATTDIGFVAMGAGTVAIGDELEVYLPRRRVNAADVAPSQRVGIVQVVRVDGAGATVRVLAVENAGLEAGLPVRLVRTIQ